jgi:hypothetical protein
MLSNILRALEEIRLIIRTRNSSEVPTSECQRGKKVVGLERGPLSLVSTTEELFDRKEAAPV